MESTARSGAVRLRKVTYLNHRKQNGVIVRNRRFNAYYRSRLQFRESCMAHAGKPAYNEQAAAFRMRGKP